MIEVKDNPDRTRYELHIDGELVGVLDYEVHDDVVVIPHTEIERARRGHGLGAILVRGALDDVRSQGRLVLPQCWYVREFIEANTSYADLLSA